MNIEPEDWLLLSDLLDQGLGVRPESRESWLVTLGSVEPRILAMLRRLLSRQAQVETSDFMQHLPHLGDLRDEIGGAALDGLRPGSKIGAYQLEIEIGRGGMASVWRARRIDASPDRIVALKLPFIGLFTGHLLERFIRERDILATLEHPNIGRLYEAGITETGQPFLALQHIDGVNILEYCALRTSSLSARLELFQQVLDAVQYAHSRLVIHRDLKPSNILVTDSGLVQLLDFGIAKLLPLESARSGLLTAIDGGGLTPLYAAPEQLSGESVTTATDVYALGVILYELLTGTRPYRPTRDSKAAIEEAILTGRVQTPSSASSTHLVATRGKLHAEKWARQLRGDLDLIILKAMNPQRAKRYATVDAFSADLNHFTAGRPVSAQPDSRLYRTNKFIARNAILVFSLSAVVASLAIGMGVAMWQTKQARTEARRAQTQAQIATAVEAFIANIFRASSTAQTDPLKAQSTTARELLDRGAEQVAKDLKAAPEAELRALKILADTYAQLGVMEKGVKLNHTRVTLARSFYGNDSLELAYALIDLCESLTWAEDERGIALRDAMRIMDLHGEQGSKARGRLLQQLAQHAAVLHQIGALQYEDQAIKLHRARNEPIETMRALTVKGALLQYVARDDSAAIDALSEAAALCERIASACADDAPRLYAYRGDVRVNTGDFIGAEADYRNALSIVITHKGAEHTDTIEVQWRLGKMLFDSGRTREGLRELKNTMDRAAAAKGAEDSFHAAHIKSSYARRLMQMGLLETGLEMAQEAQDEYKRSRPSNPINSEHLDVVILGLVAEGRYADAENLSAAASAPLNGLAATDSLVLNHYRFSAQAALASGHTQRALELSLLARTNAFKAAAGASLTPMAVADELLLAECELAGGDLNAAHLRARAVREKIQTSANRQFLVAAEGTAAWTEGSALERQDRAADAIPLLQSAIKVFSRLYDNNLSLVLARAQITLAQCEVDLRDFEEATRLALAAAAIHSRHARLGAQFSEPLRALQIRLKNARLDSNSRLPAMNPRR